MKKLIILWLLTTNCIAADIDKLNNIIYELEIIKKIITKQRQKENYDRRYSFNWQALLQDINIIEQNILDWQRRDALEPRKVEPLTDDYVKDNANES